MKFCILMGSPRVHGHTAQVLAPFMSELQAHGAEISYISLYEKNIRPCLGCLKCQSVMDRYGCVQDDDTAQIMSEIMEADCTILATPIYAFFCTAPMKALLDRHFGMNKFYGTEKGCLWEGKKIAMITTHTYPREYASVLFETGMERLFEHSHLGYLGTYSVNDTGQRGHFRSDAVAAGSTAFARQLLGK